MSSVVRFRKHSMLGSGRLISPAERDRWARRVERGADPEVVADALQVKPSTVLRWVEELHEWEGL